MALRYFEDKIIDVKCQSCGHKFRVNLKGRKINSLGEVLMRCKKCKSFIHIKVF